MIISTSTSGRLGNRLQVSAFALAFAADKGQRAALLGMGEYARYFEGSLHSWFHIYSKAIGFTTPSTTHPQVRRLVRNNLRILARIGLLQRVESPEGRFRNLREIDIRKGVVHLDGHYFSATKCLKRKCNLIRKFFRPLPKHRKRVDRLVDCYRNKYGRIIGIHVRQGDYREWESGRHFFEVDTYVDAAKKAFEDPHENTLFVIVSDGDIPEEVFSEVPFTKGPGTEIEDLYLLSKCDAIVGPLSTFNIWSSFFGKVPRYEMKKTGDSSKAVPVGISENLEEAVQYVGYHDQ